VVDPYAYYYDPRPYYPHYNSRYWRPAIVLLRRRACCRPVLVYPPYYQAWGYPYRYTYHRAWQHRRHGLRRRHHW
jgi:hypothetical protein